MSQADVFKARIMSTEADAKLRGVNKLKSTRINEPTANLVPKETILRNIRRAELGYAKDLKLNEIVFENESEASA